MIDLIAREKFSINFREVRRNGKQRKHNDDSSESDDIVATKSRNNVAEYAAEK